ncbi:MAG: phage tail tape measure protein, partial [Sulfurimonas sp.]|nr:phage tail tape measure protein [Sulfurimonas sp.]
MPTDRELLINVKTDADKALKEIESLQGEVKTLSKNVKNNTTIYKQNKMQMDSISKSAGALGKQIKGLIGAYAGFTAVSKSVDVLSEMEQNLINITKTTGMSQGELKKLDGVLEDMSKSMSGIKFTGLQEIAAQAGQLGIKGVDNIATFTEAIAKVSVATEYTAEEASIAFSNLANSLQEPADNMEALASSANELSANTSATVGQIVELTSRMGSAGKSFGLTSAQIQGVAATLKSLGITSEIAGSGFNRTVGIMTREYGKFAKFVGIESEEFASMINDKPVQALTTFLKKLESMNKIDSAKALKDLGLAGDGTARVVVQLSKNIDRMTNNMKLSTKAYEENTSITKEANIVGDAYKAKMESLENSFALLVKTIGSDLLPVMTDLVESLTEGVNATADFYEENEALIKTIVEVSAALFALKKLGNVYALIMGTTTVASIVASGSAITALGVAFTALRVKILAMASAHPVLLGLGAGITVVTYALNKYEQTVAEQTKETDKLADSYETMKNLMDEFADKFDTQTLKLQMTSEEQANFALKIHDSIAALQEQRKELEKNPDKYKHQLVTINEELKGLNLLLKHTGELEPFKDLVKGAKDVKTSIKGISDANQKALDKMKDSIDKRVANNEKGLKKILNQEKELNQELIQLQKELYLIGSKYSKERAFLEIDTNSKIAEVNAKGLNAHQAYKDAQLRADKAYQNAKDALSNGDL